MKSYARSHLADESLASTLVTGATVILLAPHLSAGNADALLAAAAHKSKFEIEQLIAEWFPKLDVPTSIRAIEEPASQATTESCAPGRTIPAAAGQGAEVLPPAQITVTPLAAQRFELTMTIDQETLDQLHYAQALLGHARS